MSSPLFDDGPFAQVQLPPPPVLEELVDDVLVDDVVVWVVVVAVLLVVLVLLDDEVEWVLVEVDVDWLLLLVLPVEPPPLALAETTVAPGSVVLAFVQKPNEVEPPAPMLAFHESGVTVTVLPDAANVPFHELLRVALPSESTTVHEVTVADPPLATVTFSQ